jgi:hypothetical protein
MTKIMQFGSNPVFSAPGTGKIVTPAPFEKRSLNKDYRKRELLKITMENQQILRRLQDRSSSYNVLQWEGDRKEQERLVKNISEYHQIPMSRENVLGRTASTTNIMKRERNFNSSARVEFNPS